MPLQRCTTGGRSGWRWGDRGYCYTHPPDTENAAKRKAYLQGAMLGDGISPSPVQRVTDQGLVDPNAVAKDATEAELLVILAAVFQRHLTELLQALGSPPDVRRIPTGFWYRQQTELAEAVRPVLARAAFTAGERLIYAYRGESFPVSRESAARGAKRWSRIRSAAWAMGIILSTRRAIRERVTRYLVEEGRDLREDLAFYFSKNRADTESITETSRAYTEGERLVIQDSRTRAPVALEPGGYTLQTEAVWHTMRDELVCELCAPLDGLVEGNWGILPDFPPLHYGCRCWVTYAGFGDVPPGRHYPGEERPRVGQW